jgi:hypothetical protein
VLARHVVQIKLKSPRTNHLWPSGGYMFLNSFRKVGLWLSVDGIKTVMMNEVVHSFITIRH